MYYFCVMRAKWLLFIVFLSTFFQCEKPVVDEQVFKFNLSTPVSSLDPAFAKNQANIWSTSQFYNGLVQLNQQMEVVPCIAKRWFFDETGTKITFILRDDVFFHEIDLFENQQRKLIAEDVVYSFNRIIDPKTASTGAWVFNGKVAENNPFVAINDTTFQINLQDAFQPIMGILTMPYCFIVPHEIVEHYGLDFRAHPVGTGPFQLAIWEEGVALVGKANPNYFEQDKVGQSLPYLKGFKTTFVESKKMEYLNFVRGDLDMISGLDKSVVDEILTNDATLQAEFNDQFTLYKSPFLNTEYFGFNMQTDDPWLSQQPFRQAINHAINKEMMITFIRKNVGFPALNGMIPQSLPPNNGEYIEGYTYQPEKAKAILDTLAYDGTEIVLHTVDAYKDLGLFVVKELSNVGINCRLEVLQSSILREWAIDKKIDFFRASWIADYPDAENYLSLFYSQNGAPPNYTGFQNGEFDELYKKALIESDDSIRMIYYQQMDEIIIEQAPVVVLYYDQTIRICKKNVLNASPNAFNNLDLKTIQKILE